MARQVDNNLLTFEWDNEREKLEADLLSPVGRMKYQTIFTELHQALAGFGLQKSELTGDVLNQEDYWVLRGRLTLVTELLEADTQARIDLSNAAVAA